MSIFDYYVVNQEIKSLLKIYPEFVRLFKFAKPKHIRRFDFNERKPYTGEKTKFKQQTEEDLEHQSLLRAKTKLIDLCLSNPFTLFITVTFAKDREDVDAKKQQMQIWLNNQRNIHGPFGYVMVPEYHKDKKAIHFHGLFLGYKGNLVDSGRKTDRGQTIYNIASFRGGFTTAVIIDDMPAVAGYISKYLTKEMPKFKGKQRYWRSNGLQMPRKVINPLFTDEDMEMFSTIKKDKRIEILEIRGQLSEKDIDRITNNGEQRYDDLYVAE